MNSVCWVPDTWTSVALPLLHWISEHEGEAVISLETLSVELGAEDTAIANEAERLIDAGYVDGQLRKYLGSGVGHWNLYPYRLAERGARAVGMWPSGDAGDVLLEVLKRAEADETDPERKNRLGRAVEAIGGLARDIVVELGVSVAKGAAGLS